jgi:transposase
MTLGYSRAMFADVATDQTLPTFLRLHEAAFAAVAATFVIRSRYGASALDQATRRSS